MAYLRVTEKNSAVFFSFRVRRKDWSVNQGESLSPVLSASEPKIKTVEAIELFFCRSEFFELLESH
jgi:hypothetical protein